MPIIEAVHKEKKEEILNVKNKTIKYKKNTVLTELPSTVVFNSWHHWPLPRMHLKLES